MFASYMQNAWIVSGIVAVVAAVVGFFVVLRGSAFVAHAVPQSAFAGAAGASLLGLNTLLGLGVFALLGALGIGALGRGRRHDVATALSVAFLLGLGSLFLSWSSEYAPALYSLLFGEVLGVSSEEIGLTAVLAAVCLAAVAVLYRPLLLASVLPESAAARGARPQLLEGAFLVVVALAATTAVPVVGALLMFGLTVGPPAAARCLTAHPLRATGLAVLIALACAWGAIAASYQTNWPIGFFVTGFSSGVYVLARLWQALTRRFGRRGGARAAGARGPAAAPGATAPPQDAVADPV